MKLKSLLIGSSVAITALSASGVMAYEAGDIFVRAGIANVRPDDSSDNINIVALSTVVPGSQAEVDDATAMGLTGTYMLDSNWGIELLAATPFEHDITANLGGGVKVDAGKTEHLPPTLSVVWYPLGSSEAISPYVGAGLNYTNFFQEDVSGDLEQTAGSLAGIGGPLPMDLSLDDSWGLAAQIGVDFFLDEHWQVNASIRYIDLETKATFESKYDTYVGDALVIPKGTKIIKVDNVEINPWVYQFNIGYKF